MQAQTLATEPQAPPAMPTTGPLPTLRTPYAPDEILRRLDLSARRGRMAGFQREPTPALFSVEAFAAPFEHKLVATATPTATTGESTRLSFHTAALAKMPAIYAVAIFVSIWPGVWLTHSMLVSWFASWYPAKEWVTWAWYMPLLVLPLLWLLPRQWKRSRADAHADALAQIGKLARELDATPAP